ncbi:Uncharacterised protein [Mycobacteroides abscessus subsp. abscessus]|nr:Uncharacterised protein [Mycobacteroides abscessus subsp. abscessus]
MQSGGAGTELLEHDEVNSIRVDGEGNRKVLPLEIGLREAI